MRKAQVTLFIAVGLVLVISVAVLLLARKAVAPQQPAAEVQVDTTLAQTCLAKTTRAALTALEDDGVITKEEGLENYPDAIDELEPQAPNEPHYILHRDHPPHEEPPWTDPEDRPLLIGTNNYRGLCDPEGPNGLGRVGDQYYTCDPVAYHYGKGESVQEQLATAITRQMQACANTTGEAEVIIQEGAVLVRWPEPSIQHTEHTNLHVAYKAIEEAVRKEASQLENVFGQSITCDGCEEYDIEIAESEEPPKSNTRRYDNYTVSVSGDVVASVLIENRGIVHNNDGQLREYNEDEQPVDLDPCNEASCTYQFRSFDEDKFVDPPVITDNSVADEYTTDPFQCGYPLECSDDITGLRCIPSVDITNHERSSERTLTARQGCFDGTVEFDLSDVYGIDTDTYKVQVNTKFGPQHELLPCGCEEDEEEECTDLNEPACRDMS